MCVGLVCQLEVVSAVNRALSSVIIFCILIFDILGSIGVFLFFLVFIQCFSEFKGTVYGVEQFGFM